MVLQNGGQKRITKQNRAIFILWISKTEITKYKPNNRCIIIWTVFCFFFFWFSATCNMEFSTNNETFYAWDINCWFLWFIRSLALGSIQWYLNHSYSRFYNALPKPNEHSNVNVGVLFCLVIWLKLGYKDMIYLLFVRVAM